MITEESQLNDTQENIIKINHTPKPFETVFQEENKKNI